MATNADWIKKAARTIRLNQDVDPSWDEEFQEIIERYCPFKSDVAYMPVPRCDSCAHWENEGSVRRFGECAVLRGGLTKRKIVTPANFGCVQWKEKT